MPETSTYSAMLKASALIGGSSVVSIAIGIVRTKAMAVLLGPGGLGLMGVYGLIAALTLTVAGLGINSSGVRQIAESVGSGDIRRIARTVCAVRRASILLGLCGGAGLALVAPQVSTLTFGGDQHARDILILSAAVVFELVASGQGAVIQGMRRMADLAKITVAGALLGTVVSIGVVYCLGEQGVVVALVGVAGVSIIPSWWYCRKGLSDRTRMSVLEVRREVGSLLGLGSVFMASGMLTLGAGYVVKLMIVRTFGLEGAGLQQAAWTLGGLYVGFILQAMGTDFYPRLVTAARDDDKCNRLVNEQTQISLLLAGPGVIATITCAPMVVSVFYSATFSGAADILRWMCVGAALRVITWPMGYIIVAKRKRVLFFGTELVWAVANVWLTWICVGAFGLDGVGVAFSASYVLHFVMIYPIVRQLSGFRWSAASGSMLFTYVTLIGCAFASSYIDQGMWAAAAGIGTVLVSAMYSSKRLLSLVGGDGCGQPVQRLRLWIGGADASLLSDPGSGGKAQKCRTRAVGGCLECRCASEWAQPCSCGAEGGGGASVRRGDGQGTMVR